MPSRLPAEIRRRLMPIKMVVLDVDGVLTDGRLHFSAEGELIKTFHVRDGLGLRLMKDQGLFVGVITGRSSGALERRYAELGLDANLLIQGSRDKSADLDRLLHRLGLLDDQVAAMGDDLPDLPMLNRAGFAACPADAAPEVAAVCHHVCGAGGGQGAVRELAELILKGKSQWAEAIARWDFGGREPGSGES